MTTSSNIWIIHGDNGAALRADQINGLFTQPGSDNDSLGTLHAELRNGETTVIAKFRPAHRARVLAAFLKALAHCEKTVTADYVVLQARDPNDFALRGDPPEYWQRHVDTWPDADRPLPASELDPHRRRR